MQPSQRVSWKDILLSLLSGSLLTLSFPDYNFSSLAWGALVPLLVALDNKSVSRALWLGWLCGITHFVSLLHWVIVAMTHYGQLPMLTSFLLLVLLSGYLGLYVSVFGALVGFFRSRNFTEAVTVAPLLWVLLEYLRAHIMSGFPWCLLGCSQYRNILVIQTSDVTGVYGVSFLIMLVNTSLYLVVKRLTGKPMNCALRYSLFSMGLVLLTLTYGCLRRESVEVMQRQGFPLRIGVIQGNIEQDQKWDPSYLSKTLALYQRLSTQATRAGADFLVWPETAVPCYFMADTEAAHFISDLTKRLKTPILLGSLAFEKKSSQDSQYLYYNSAFLASPQSEKFISYDKIHLVPFGEYVPLRLLLPFAERLVVGVGDFASGKRYTVFSLPQSTFGCLICYEIIFPELARRYGQSGVGFLVNITNDAWFGRTGAPYQHFSMAVFRAVENRIAIVRSANSGISGIIEPSGKIKVQTPLFKKTWIVDSISVNREPTFYAYYGDILVALCGVCLLIILISCSFLLKGMRNENLAILTLMD